VDKQHPKILNKLVEEYINKEITKSRNKHETSVPLFELVRKISLDLKCDEDDIIRELRRLQKDSKLLILERRQYNCFEYLFSVYSNWFWILFSSTAFSAILVLSSVHSPIRYIFAGLLILFLPGYSVTELLNSRVQPSNWPFGTVTPSAIKIVLSVAISLIIDVSLSLLLNYTYMGITTRSLTLFLFIITLVLLIFTYFGKYSRYKLFQYALK
jgi:hypothetical protein